MQEDPFTLRVVVRLIRDPYTQTLGKRSQLAELDLTMNLGNVNLGDGNVLSSQFLLAPLGNGEGDVFVVIGRNKWRLVVAAPVQVILEIPPELFCLIPVGGTEVDAGSARRRYPLSRGGHCLGVFVLHAVEVPVPVPVPVLDHFEAKKKSMHSVISA